MLHSLITFTLYTHPSPFAEASLFISSSQVSSVGRTSLECRVESWTRTFLQWADAPPIELRRTLLSWAAPSEPRRTLLSYAAPFWAALHPTELRWTLLSYTPRLTELSRILNLVTSHSNWATPHPHGATRIPVELCKIKIKDVHTHKIIVILSCWINTVLQYFKDV
jgi:hypothetical protein